MANRYYRKIIRITAEMSPNVRYAHAQIAAGMEPDGRVILPGVLPWADYRKRRETWDPIRQCVGLDARFYVGSEVLLFPTLWLNLAERDEVVRRCRAAPAEAIGVDPAEGGDQTSMAAVNRFGIKEVVSRKTPNTNDIPKEVMAFMARHGVSPDKVCFDRGGGGHQHVHRLNSPKEEDGYGLETIRSIGFGETMLLAPKRGVRLFDEKVEHQAEHYVYVNRRAEMAWELSFMFDPSLNPNGFALPSEYVNLRSELSPIPKLYDKEGRCRMLPKNRVNKDSKEKTLVELIGHSPDEADAVMLAFHAMTHKARRVTAGAI